MKNVIHILLGALLIVACAGEPENPVDPPANKTAEDEASQMLWEQASTVFKPLPTKADNPDNPVTAEKVALGKMLFYDKNLSKDRTQSCNSCHNLSTYGVDNLPTSPGDNGGFGERNSPTVLNAALHFAQFWDGRMKDVEEQAGGPITNPVEMAIPNQAFLEQRLRGIEEYQSKFTEAFPNAQEPVTYSNVQKAIGAFERTLLTPSKWDKYLAGDKSTLNEDEQAGLKLFIDKNCIMCHSGENLGGNMFQKFGLMHNYWEYTGSEKIDEGKMTVTNQEADKYIFKVPSLRNVAKTHPYFHDGSVKSLNEAIRIMGKVQLDQDLTADEIKHISAFLNALTGELPPQALPDA